MLFINPASRLGRLLHWIFEMSLVIKGLLSAGESLIGVGLLVTPNVMVLKFAGWLMHLHVAENPGEGMALFAKHLSQNFPVNVQHFWAIYLVFHGGLKFAMVLMLAWRILWAYPVAMLILAGFVVYQMSEFYMHGGIPLAALSGFDTFMITLVWREYKILKIEREEERHRVPVMREPQ